MSDSPPRSPAPELEESVARRRTRGRGAVLWWAGVGVALAILIGRVAIDSRAALRRGEAAEAQGDRSQAMHHYGEAARQYLPGSPFVSRAFARLEAIAAAAERSGDGPTARRALETMRAAMLAVRPFGRVVSRAAIEARLAPQLADAEDPSVDPGATREERIAWHAARLAAVSEPAQGPVLLAMAGLVLWLGAAVSFFRYGLDLRLRLRPRAALVTGLLFVTGFALFLVGLRWA